MHGEIAPDEPEVTNNSHCPSTDARGSGAYRMFMRTTLAHGNQRIHASGLIDSGSPPSLLGYGGYMRLGRKRPRLEPVVDDPVLKGPSGEDLTVLGLVTLSVKFGSTESLITFKVIDNLVSGCIIGSEALKKVGAVLDFENDCLFVKKEKIPLFESNKQTEMLLSAAVTLEAGESKCVRVKTEKKYGINSTCLFEPLEQSKVDALSALIDVNCHSQSDVIISNTSNTSISLKKGERVGQVRPINLDSEAISFLKIEEVDDLYTALDGDESPLNTDENININTVNMKSDSETYIRQKLKRKSKAPMKKPTFSKELGEDSAQTDEEIIKKELKFDATLLNPEQTERLYKTALKNKEAFALRQNDMGCSKSFTYSLELKDNAQLHFQPPYKLSEFETTLLRKECDKWAKLGIIGKCNETKFIKFMSPALLTAKSDSSARLLTDMRLLGQSIKADRYTFPTVQEMLRRIGAESMPNEKLYFAKLDLRDSFFQISIDKDSQKLLGFSIGTGQNYFYRRLPQGLHVSSAGLARLQYSLYNELDYVLSYADDTVIVARSIDQLLERLDTVLGIAAADGIKYNVSKSVLVADKVDFLGHTIVEGGCVKPMAKHLDAIKNMQAPENKDGLRRLLGTVNFLARFIHSYTDKTRPLYHLLKKDTIWKWGETEEKCLEQIKQHLLSNHVMKLPNSRETEWFELYCDGSQHGSGGICFAVFKNSKGATKRYVIGYASKPFTEADKRLLSPTHMELLSVDTILDHFRSTIFCGEPIRIYTDHEALKGVIFGKKRVVNSKILRAIERINSFPIDILYIKGKRNEFADYLSRDSARNLAELQPGKPEQIISTIDNENPAQNVRRSDRNKKPVDKLNYEQLGGDNKTDIAVEMEERRAEQNEPVPQQVIPMVEAPYDGSRGANEAATPNVILPQQPPVMPHAEQPESEVVQPQAYHSQVRSHNKKTHAY